MALAQVDICTLSHLGSIGADGHSICCFALGTGKQEFAGFLYPDAGVANLWGFWRTRLVGATILVIQG